MELCKSHEQLRTALSQRGAASAAVAMGSGGLKELLRRLSERHRAWGRFIFLASETTKVQVHRGLDEVLEGPAIDINEQGEEELWRFLEASGAWFRGLRSAFRRGEG